MASNYSFKQLGKDGGYVIKRGNNVIAPGNVARIMNAKFTNMFRTLEFNPKSVIMYRKPKDISEEEFKGWLDAFSDELQARTGIHHGVNLGVEQFSDIKVLSEQDLEAMGLIRQDKVFDMMTKAVKETLAAQTDVVDAEIISEEE